MDKFALCVACNNSNSLPIRHATWWYLPIYQLVGIKRSSNNSTKPYLLGVLDVVAAGRALGLLGHLLNIAEFVKG